MSSDKFQKLESDQRTQEIFARLKASGEDLELQLSDARIFKPEVLEFKNSFVVVRGKDLIDDDRVIVRFLFEKDSYFMMSSLKVDDQGVGSIATQNTDLYKLHRRANFRVPVSPERGTVVRFSSNVCAMVLNISLGGTLLASSPEDDLSAYKVNSRDKATVEDSQIGSFGVELRICHMKQLESGSVLLGVEFLSIDEGGTSKINQFVMSSYRESISKYSP